MFTQAAFERGLRNFGATIISLLAIALIQALTGLQAVPINFSDIQQTTKALVVAFVIGFITYLGKAIRDKYGSPTNSTAGVINKLPI